MNKGKFLSELQNIVIHFLPSCLIDNVLVQYLWSPNIERLVKHFTFPYGTYRSMTLVNNEFIVRDDTSLCLYTLDGNYKRTFSLPDEYEVCEVCASTTKLIVCGQNDLTPLNKTVMFVFNQEYVLEFKIENLDFLTSCTWYQNHVYCVKDRDFCLYRISLETKTLEAVHTFEFYPQNIVFFDNELYVTQRGGDLYVFNVIDGQHFISTSRIPLGLKENSECSLPFTQSELIMSYSPSSREYGLFTFVCVTASNIYVTIGVHHLYQVYERNGRFLRQKLTMYGILCFVNQDHLYIVDEEGGISVFLLEQETV